MGKGEEQWHLLRPESMGSCSASLLPCLSRQMQMVMTFFHSLSKSVRMGGCKTLWAPGWGCQVQRVMTFLNFQSNTGREAHISHSPTELLKPWAWIEKTFSWYPFEAGEDVPEELLMPVKVHNQTGSDCMALVVKRAGILELHRTKKIRKTALGRLPLLGHCSNISLKHNPSFSMKKKNKNLFT